MNTLLTLAFNGSGYHGWQVQSNAVGVCTVLQDAMEKVLQARPDVKGCSRTDSGVHARCYCVNFKHETNLSDSKMPLAFNRFLPLDVRVMKAQRVPEEFHARYSATGKEYEYLFRTSAVDDPFMHGLYHRVPWRLDVNEMNKAAQHLVGKHDFAAFMSAGSDIEDTVRTISLCEVEQEGDWVRLRVAADGFLYNMVRIIAGTLLKVGNGRTMAEELPRIIASKDRHMAGETMPAKGLCLTKVFYPPEALGKTQE